MINKEEAKILKAMGHPARLTILKGLAKRKECNVNKMVKELKLPQSTVSQHLNILKSAGIIKGERSGVKVCYQISSEKAKRILEAI